MSSGRTAWPSFKSLSSLRMKLRRPRFRSYWPPKMRMAGGAIWWEREARSNRHRGRSWLFRLHRTRTNGCPWRSAACTGCARHNCLTARGRHFSARLAGVGRRLLLAGRARCTHAFCRRPVRSRSQADLIGYVFRFLRRLCGSRACNSGFTAVTIKRVSTAGAGLQIRVAGLSPPRTRSWHCKRLRQSGCPSRQRIAWPAVTRSCSNASAPEGAGTQAIRLALERCAPRKSNQRRGRSWPSFTTRIETRSTKASSGLHPGHPNPRVWQRKRSPNFVCAPMDGEASKTLTSRQRSRAHPCRTFRPRPGWRSPRGVRGVASLPAVGSETGEES